MCWNICGYGVGVVVFVIIIFVGGKFICMGKEKFVLKIVGKEMFFWVYVFVFWVDEIIVVFLKNMLKIRELCFCEGIFFMEIFGKGYVEDV